MTVYYTLNGTVSPTSELSNGIFQLYEEKYLLNWQRQETSNFLNAI